MSRLRFRLQVNIPRELLTNSIDDDARLREILQLDRGIESIIRRLTIEDMNGNRLEDIDHYNCLYAVTELCTGEPDVRRQRGRFTMECFQEDSLEKGTEVWPDPEPLAVTEDLYKTRYYDMCFNLISGVFGGTCESTGRSKPSTDSNSSSNWKTCGRCFQYSLIPTGEHVKRLFQGRPIKTINLIDVRYLAPTTLCLKYIGAEGLTQITA
jgi:hypothetical protein